MRTRQLALGGLLTALSLLIPLVFGPYLRIIVGPFTATLASHVPLFLATLVSPLVAAMVGLASAFGFLMVADPVVAARAFTHVFVGLTAALLIQKGKPYYVALGAALPVHAGLEALIVIPFGFDVYTWGVVVGLGTALHHLADAAISVVLVRSLGLERLTFWAVPEKS